MKLSMSGKNIVRNLININKLIDIATDITALKYLIKYHQLSGTELCRLSRRAILDNHLPLVKYLVTQDYCFENSDMTDAFNKGYLDMCHYLYSLGLRVEHLNLKPKKKAYRDFSTSQLLTFLDSIEVDAMIVNRLLLTCDNFVLCATFIHDVMIDIPMLLYRAFSKDRLDIVDLVERRHNVTTGQWQKIAEMLVERRNLSGSQNLQKWYPTPDVTRLFRLAYYYFDMNVMQFLIQTYDRDLELPIHQDNWQLVLKSTPLEFVTYVATKLPVPENLTHNDFIYIDVNEIMKFLFRQNEWRPILQSMLNHLFLLAIQCQNIAKMNFYYSLGAKYDVMTVQHIVSDCSFDDAFLEFLMQIGINVDHVMMPSQHEKYRNTLVKKNQFHKTILSCDNGLMWLAATCYQRHYTKWPDAETIPEKVSEILALAKYAVDNVSA